MTYRTTVAGVYGLALLVLCAVGAVSYRDSRTENETERWVIHTETVLAAIQDVAANLTAAENARRGFALTGDTEFVAEYKNARNGAEQCLSNLRFLTIDNPAEQKRLGELRPILEERLALLQALIDQGRITPEERSAQTQSVLGGNALGEKIAEIIGEARQEEERLLAERSQAAAASSKLAKLFTLMGNIFAVFLILLALFIIRREMAERERAESALLEAQADLERTVQLRTEELRKLNQTLLLEIEDRRQAESKVQELNVQLEQRVASRTEDLTHANRDLESFSYSVSHDLRAPLRHIDGFARILTEEHAGELSDEGRHFLGRILQAVSHMGRLVDDLLNLARIGRREIVLQKVNLGDLVRQTIDDLLPNASNRAVEWHVKPLPEMECDPGLLRLVFANLISNSLKFTRSRQLAVIEVGTRAVRGATALFIRDNGVGFDPKYADKLFGVFQRLHSQEEFEGTGVGLATVQRIIQRHGGEIWAEAELGHGATFIFTLGQRAIFGVPASFKEAKVDGIQIS